MEKKSEIGVIKKSKKQRDSNMEALRIVAMSMILIHHFLYHVLTPSNIPDFLYDTLNPFVYSGVNIFFALSGYFTIRYHLKGLIGLVLLIFSFGVVNLIACCAVGVHLSLPLIIKTIVFPITQSPYWFIRVYLFIFITAPILNAGLKTLNRVSLRNLLILLSFFMFDSGHKMGMANYLHGVYLYLIGFYIGHYKPFSKFKKNYFLLIFFLVTGLAGFIGFLAPHLGFGRLYYVNQYRSVFLFIAAISLVLYFQRLKFRSKYINTLASASLGCYLLQDGWFGIDYFYEYQRDFYYQFGYGWQVVIMFLISFMGYWVGSYVLTKVFKKLISIWSDRLMVYCRQVGKFLLTDHR